LKIVNYTKGIYNKEFLETLFIENQIDYVINCAAMKYIDTCEDFIRESIDVNLTGTLNIVDLSKKYKIKSLVHISTDKSNNATSVYGCCKQIAKKYVLKMGYNTYEGVNFWNSDGSFITHWKNNLELNNPIVLNNSKIMRYFSLIDDVVKDIKFALEDNKNSPIYKKNTFILNNNSNNFEKIEEDILNNNNYLENDIHKFLQLANINI